MRGLLKRPDVSRLRKDQALRERMQSVKVAANGNARGQATPTQQRTRSHDG